MLATPSEGSGDEDVGSTHEKVVLYELEIQRYVLTS